MRDYENIWLHSQSRVWLFRPLGKAVADSLSRFVSYKCFQTLFKEKDWLTLEEITKLLWLDILRYNHILKIFTFFLFRKIKVSFTFPIGKVLSRCKKSISRFWRIFTFWGPRSPEKWILKNVRLSVCLSVCLSVLCGGHSEDTIVTINLKFGMWTQNVNISSRFFRYFLYLDN